MAYVREFPPYQGRVRVGVLAICIYIPTFDYQTSALKKQTSYFLFAAFALILFIAACKKNNTTTPTPLPQPTPCDTCLPAITTNGAGTFGCRVNGKVWLPLGGHFTPSISADYTSDKHLNIYAYNDNIVQWLSFEFAPIIDTGYFKFYSNSLIVQGGLYTIYDPQKNSYYKADTFQVGFLHILRNEPAKGIFSGTFSCDLFDIYHQHNNDTIHITDGRFDIHQ